MINHSQCYLPAAFAGHCHSLTSYHHVVSNGFDLSAGSNTSKYVHLSRIGVDSALIMLSELIGHENAERAGVMCIHLGFSAQSLQLIPGNIYAT